MFSQDRDLLALDPKLFHDLTPASQAVHTTTADLASGVLTLYEPLPANAVAPGDVVLLAQTPAEILEVTDLSTLIISLVRPDAAALQIVPADRSAVAVAFNHFKPERTLVHAHLLQLLGLEPDSSTNPFSVKESAITNPRDLALAEACGTLHLVYTIARAGLADSTPIAQRAVLFEKRYANARFQARAHLDLDGDGLPDATRTFNLTHLLRA